VVEVWAGKVDTREAIALPVRVCKKDTSLIILLKWQAVGKSRQCRTGFSC